MSSRCSSGSSRRASSAPISRASMPSAAFHRQRRAHRLRGGAVRRDDQVAAAGEAAVGLGILEVARKVGEHLQRRARERRVLAHRVVGAQDARRLRGGAATQRAALDQPHLAGAEAGEVPGDGHADDAAADDHGVAARVHAAAQPGARVVRRRHDGRVAQQQRAVGHAGSLADRRRRPPAVRNRKRGDVSVRRAPAAAAPAPPRRALRAAACTRRSTCRCCARRSSSRCRSSRPSRSRRC